MGTGQYQVCFSSYFMAPWLLSLFPRLYSRGSHGNMLRLHGNTRGLRLLDYHGYHPFLIIAYCIYMRFLIGYYYPIYDHWNVCFHACSVAEIGAGCRIVPDVSL